MFLRKCAETGIRARFAFSKKDRIIGTQSGATDGNISLSWLIENTTNDTNSGATSATYQAGATYTGNGTVTLYAVWRCQGLVYICDSTGEFHPYQIFIYDGSNWNQYTPYIYNGSSWDLYS